MLTLFTELISVLLTDARAHNHLAVGRGGNQRRGWSGPACRGVQTFSQGSRLDRRARRRRPADETGRNNEASELPRHASTTAS
jgi:hypothetical protein